MKLKFYRVWDTQRGCHFATGYNAFGMKALIEEFQSYIQCAGDGISKRYLRTWRNIAEHLQGVVLEYSNTPFEEYE